MIVFFETLDGLEAIADCPHIPNEPPFIYRVMRRREPTINEIVEDLERGGLETRKYERVDREYHANLPIYREVRS